MTRLGELYSYDSLETERIDFDGLTISVVTPRMLYRMKKGASLQAGRSVMPIRKFRDLAEMDDALWYERGDPALAIARVWSFAARTCTPHYPPGVHRHRSQADADAQRERWEQNSFDEFQSRRGRSRT